MPGSYLEFKMTTDQSIFTPALWLQEAGYDSYIVGNQVRDRILGVVTDRSDVDIATSALAAEVVQVLRQNGITPQIVDEKFGVVSFSYETRHYEMTTFRQDLYGQDSLGLKRYPDEIRFVRLVAQDAVRRDFTINAIYLNPKTNRYLDYVDGMQDIKSKTIRTIGDPKTRFLEDPVRILRAVRLRHVLNFDYDPKTAAAMLATCKHIQVLSPAVIKKELRKLEQVPNYPLAKIELGRLGLTELD